MPTRLTRALSFKDVKGHFKLLDVAFMAYRNGGGLFIGPDTAKTPGFPFVSGPICHVSGKHRDEDIIPLRVMLNWFHRLALTDNQIETFWSIEDHIEPSAEDTTGN